jgi:hypothetical protein
VVNVDRPEVAMKILPSIFIFSVALRQLNAIDTILRTDKIAKLSLRGRDDQRRASGALDENLPLNGSHADGSSKVNVSVSKHPDQFLLQSSSDLASNEFPIMMHSNSLDPVFLRPSAGQGAEKVYVGLIAKNFFGANLKMMRFTIDIVLSVRWHDPRVIKLLPAGLDKLSMAWSQALKLIWMPGVVIANRDIEMYEIISSSITIHRSGEVVRVERAQARCLKKFMLREYPFDTQDLEVQVVSSKYMTSEVQLIPNQNASNVEEHIWGLYEMMDWKMKPYEEYDGDLRKSRLSLVVTVNRKIEKYFDDHLVPSFIVLAISWAVFYFPFANPFITPRLALSVLALLTFTNLMVKSSKELPGSAPFNWNDLFNQQIECLMFATIILNIGVEVIHHSWGKEKLAKDMNNEAKAIIPLASLINIFVVLILGKYGFISLGIATIVTKVSLVFFTLAYCAYVYKIWGKEGYTPRAS